VSRRGRGALALAAGLLMAASPPPPTLTVHLANFSFAPARLRLPADRPVRLVLVNDSGGGHDFSAPALFAASAFPGGAPPPDGAVEVAAHQHRDIVFIPRVPGTYRVECTHFLHSLFGMHGTVVVEPPR
jgi:plastocyanin